MKNVIITGVTGQDGFYLSKLLKDEGFNVIGTSRRSNLDFKNENITKTIQWDLQDKEVFVSILNKYNPHFIFNLASLSSGSKMFDDPLEIGMINGLSVGLMLESIRKYSPKSKFIQASSREIFGNPGPELINEKTLVNPRNPYGAAKLFADNLVKIYREKFNIFACSAILFNHESPLRKAEFVTRKITLAAASISAKKSDKLVLGDLESKRDWGHARDYMEAMFLMACSNKPEDYIVATGQAFSIREVCNIAFSLVGLNYLDYVHIDSALTREPEKFPPIGDITKIMKELNWKPKTKLNELIVEMIQSDIKLLEMTK